MRSATNRDALLDQIFRETGIRPRVVTGEEEALLTAGGVLHSLEMAAAVPYRIFDLGGATTEVITGQGNVFQTISLPLGAMTLTRRFLFSDPPTAGEMEALTGQVNGVLKGAFPGRGAGEGELLVGTGGTVTTLGAMVHHFDTRDVNPEGMNGLALEREAVEILFEQMKSMPERDRALLRGLEHGRADVILAGTLVVLRIMQALRSPEVTISLSDILEGILIEALRLRSG
jgi:exopolyphosphatase/guanosine-5'-triphosphate,3'-diphosphate pyrophosphatase